MILKKFKSYILFQTLILCCSTPALCKPSIKQFVLEHEITKSTQEENIPATNKPTNQELCDYFSPILSDIIANRNQCITCLDSETLKSSYNTDIKVSLWAYESEAQKIKYLKTWCHKQGIEFSDIHSVLKIRKVKEKEAGLYSILCFNGTSFTYHYVDTPDTPNTFYLGTSHYINLKKQDDTYIITKEWYTDPFADSLHLNHLNSNDIRTFILNHEMPEYLPNERVKKAIAYAHQYCGVNPDPNYIFKYNKNYKNFNPDGGDCANFASQILHEGAGFKKNGTWNYSNRDGTKAWVNAQAFKNYIVGSGKGGYIARGSYQQIYKSAYNLRPGDFVAYEKKGKITHISPVTGLDSKGYPLVTCHNTDRLLVPYDLGWSDKGIKFHLIHVYY